MGESTIDIVELAYREHELVVSHLRETGQLSFSSTLEGTFPKVMLLAAASNLEYRVQSVLIDYFNRMTGSSEVAVSFVRNKAIKRQFHSYFNWESRNANNFLGLFGETFKSSVQARLADDLGLNQTVRDFLEIGSLRNQLVHGDYASFVVEKTAADVLAQYRSALVFVTCLNEMLEGESPSAGTGGT